MTSLSFCPAARARSCKVSIYSAVRSDNERGLREESKGSVDEDEEDNVPAGKHVVASDQEGALKITRRSFGTLQRDVFEWSDHKPEYSQDDYTLAVSLQSASWLRSADEIPLAVVVRLEDTTGKYQELYARVRARVQAAARVRA